MTDLATAWRPFEPGLEKRFFIAEDGGMHWVGCALSADHFIELLDAQDAELWEARVDGKIEQLMTRYAVELGVVQVRELDAEWLASHHQRCHTEDERGVIPLTQAAIGDLFCSEW